MDMRKAKAWLRERSLPLIGFVLFSNGSPFGWERDWPNASRVAPGVIALAVADGQRLVAVGGNADRGAERFEIVQPQEH